MDAKHSIALDQAVAFCFERTQPIGIVASGSIVRGQGDANSDLDIYVIHEAGWRQRVQRWFNGVPCEIFINAAQHVHGYFEDDNREGRPITAHMLATGRVMHGVENAIVEALLGEARDWLAKPPGVSAEALLVKRYMIAAGFEDGFDLEARDPAMALLLLGDVVPAALNFAFLSRGRNIPRYKELLARIGEIDGALQTAATAFASAADARSRLDAARQIADLTVQARGFFEWESPR